MTPLSSMVLASILGLTGLPMAIGAIVCTGASFVNFTLFNLLKIGQNQIDLPYLSNHSHKSI